MKIKIKVRQYFLPNSQMDRLFSTFNKKNKEIQLESSYFKSNLSWEEKVRTYDKIPPQYTEGEKCNIFLGSAEVLPALADAGLIIPLDDLMKNSKELSNDFVRSYYCSLLDAVKYKNHIWGIPLIADTYALYCNNKIFNSCGLFDYPSNWNEVLNFSKRMTKEIRGRTGIIKKQYGYTQCSFQFPLLLLSYGVDFINPEKNIAEYDSEGGIEALDMYQRLIKTSPPHVDFEKGDVGMKLSVPENLYGRYEHLNFTVVDLPEGIRKINTFGHSAGVFVLSIANPTNGLSTSTSTSTLASTSASTLDLISASFTACKWLSSKECFFNFANQFKCIPVRKSILESNEYKAYLKKYPRYQVFIDQQKYAIVRNCIPQWRLIEIALREVLLPVQEIKSNKNKFLSRLELKKILKSASDKVNEKLSK